VYRDLKARSGELTDAHETIAELTWKVPVNDWLTLQPNLQYVRNPDTDPGLDNALALGLRFELSLGTSI
jgi:porin